MNPKKFLSPSDYLFLKKNSIESPADWFKNIYIYITEQCQLRCKHCYLGEKTNKPSIMSKEDVFANLSFWKEIGGKKLCFLGGEPTLHPYFEEIISYTQKLDYEEIVIDTNGQEIALEKLKSINSSSFTFIQISLDGASSDTNDKIRGKNTFDTTINTIKELKKRGYDIRIIFTVNKYNIKDYIKILSLADNLGISLVKYHIFSGIGTGKKNTQMLIEPSDWIKFHDSLLKQKGKYKTRIQVQVAYDDMRAKDMLIKQKYDGCVGRKLDRMSIFPNGKVYICSYLFDTDLNFAEVDLYNKKLVINRNNKNELDLFFSGIKKCKKCNFQKICLKGCQAEKIVTNYYPCMKDNIYPVCRLWKLEI